MDEFPKQFLRGIVSPKYVDENKLVSQLVFDPNPNPKTEKTRDDGGHETSINWEDDETVLEFTIKDRQISAHGIVRLDTEEVEIANNSPGFMGIKFSVPTIVYCERAELEDNPYHGNIVFSNKISNTVRRLICSYLAMRSTYIPRL